MRKLTRINLSEYHFDKLINIIKKSGDTDLLEAVQAKKSLVDEYNQNKTAAAQTATEVRTAKAKKNIKLALEYLERNDKKVTQKAIVEASKCSVNTVRKYSYIWQVSDG